MIAMFRVTVLAAAAAMLTAAQSDPLSAQSFYETITAVARTKVERPAATLAPKPAVPDRAVAEKQQPPPPVRRNATPDLPTRAGVSTNKTEKYRHQPVTDAKAAAWPEPEVQIARARCVHLLRHLDAEVEQLDPIKKGACGDPAPVKLISVGASPKVTLDPPAVVNCDMVRALHDWVVEDLQPLARRHLKSPVTGIETMSSYSCRNAYGRKKGRLSEHGRANAIDIRGFRTAKHSRARLVTHWGPTRRDIRAAEMAAAKRKLERKKAIAKKPQKPDVVAKVPLRPSLLGEMSAVASKANEPSVKDSGTQTAFGVRPSRLGGPALAALGIKKNEAEASWPITLVSQKLDTSRSRTPRALFLRAAHGTACKIFGTVLGPEANSAHRNHFHVDLAQRDLGSFCR